MKNWQIVPVSNWPSQRKWHGLQISV